MRLALLIAAAFLVSACGEKEQVVVYKQGKYQGKPDSRSWDNAPPGAEFRGGKWNVGDRTSWEEQIKKRQILQSEYARIH